MAVVAAPASALTTFNLVGTVENGRFAGTVGTGTVTFDETQLSLPDLDDPMDGFPLPQGVTIDDLFFGPSVPGPPVSGVSGSDAELHDL